jgi:hypothetical protein
MNDQKNEGQPLPTVLMSPWIADNAVFISDLQERGEQLRDSGPKLRECLDAWLQLIANAWMNGIGRQR